MNTRTSLCNRDALCVMAMRILLVLMASLLPLAHADTSKKEIVRVERKATPTEHAKYPKDMVDRGNSGFDGSYTSLSEYASEDRKFTPSKAQL